MADAFEPLREAWAKAAEAVAELDAAAVPVIELAQEMAAPEWIARFPPSIVAKVERIRGLSDDVLATYHDMREVYHAQTAATPAKHEFASATAALRSHTELMLSWINEARLLYITISLMHIKLKILITKTEEPRAAVVTKLKAVEAASARLEQQGVDVGAARETLAALTPDTEILRWDRFPEREDPEGPNITKLTLEMIERVDSVLTPLLAELTAQAASNEGL